jgi:RimJ/RimL family protein N-acetyltransferase
VTSHRSAFGQPIGPPVAGWSQCRRPERTALTGRYCRVLPIDVERDAQALFGAYMQAPDGRDWTYLFHERPGSAALFREYLTTLAASTDPLHFAVIDVSSRLAVGTAALMRIQPDHGVIEVGSITYSPLLKSTRAGTEAMYLLMRYVFDELGYRRYEWKCDSLNAPSCAAARRYGFHFEGIFRQAIVYKSRSRDTAWFSIVDEEWPRIRAALETWLDPENFDATGQQHRALAAIREELGRCADSER